MPVFLDTEAKQRDEEAAIARINRVREAQGVRAESIAFCAYVHNNVEMLGGSY